jgi:hypothetical protein
MFCSFSANGARPHTPAPTGLGVEEALGVIERAVHRA